jgi:hypothetical protein
MDLKLKDIQKYFLIQLGASVNYGGTNWESNALFPVENWIPQLINEANSFVKLRDRIATSTLVLNSTSVLIPSTVLDIYHVELNGQFLDHQLLRNRYFDSSSDISLKWSRYGDSIIFNRPVNSSELFPLYLYCTKKIVVPTVSVSSDIPFEFLEWLVWSMCSKMGVNNIEYTWEIGISPSYGAWQINGQNSVLLIEYFKKKADLFRKYIDGWINEIVDISKLK